MSRDNRYDISIDQGSTFQLSLIIRQANGTLKNLASHSARMQIRPSYSSNTITESLSTANSEISINTATSTITLTLDADRTANISVQLVNTGMPPRRVFVYDLELIDGANTVTRLMYGTATVYAGVTR